MCPVKGPATVPPVMAFHTWIVRSSEPETMCWPPGENATVLTRFACSARRSAAVFPSWRGHSTHEMFDHLNLRQCAGHLARMQQRRQLPRNLKLSSLMMASETIVHVPHVGFGEMRWNNVRRQANKSAQMVERKDRYVGHFLPWPSRNAVQIQRRH